VTVQPSGRCRIASAGLDLQSSSILVTKRRGVVFLTVFALAGAAGGGEYDFFGLAR